jgi:hypothetical protein
MPLRVFLCHASDDKPRVRVLYGCLCQASIKPWFDEVDLIPGQDFELEIRKAIRNSDAILVCLTRHSITKRGYVQKEIKYALDVAEEQPEGAIFIIPMRLEECDVPERLSGRQWVDLFRAGGYKKIARALKKCAYEIGKDWNQKAEEIIASGSLPLPNDISIVLPSRECPVHVREFSGKWFGVWDDILDHLLVVEEINPPNVIAIYSVGIAEQWGYREAKWHRARGTIEPGRLVLSLARPAVVTYNLQDDESLKATYEHSSGISRARMVRL